VGLVGPVSVPSDGAMGGSESNPQNARSDRNGDPRARGRGFWGRGDEPWNLPFAAGLWARRLFLAIYLIDPARGFDL